MKKLTFIILSLMGFSLALAPVLVSAQVPAVTTTATASVTTPVATVKMNATVMATTKARGDKELDRRVTALTDVNTRVQAMQKVTDTFKQNLATAVQTQITAFNALKAKIDADTDATTLKADVQSITQSYRVYALVLPQVRIAAAADRGVTIATMMQGLGNKLAARIQAAATAGADTTALKAVLTDLGTKISDASTQAQAAVSVSASLTPDNGDTTKMASNNTALKTARTDLTTVQTDLKAGRQDITTIVKGLAKADASVTATSTVTH